MKQLLLTSAAILMSVSLVASAETIQAPTNGAVMSPPVNTTPGADQAARPVDQGAATTPVQSNSPATMTATERRASVPSNVPMGPGGMFTSIPAGEELSSNVVGLDVYNSATKNIGKIKDIAFDQNGVKAYIVAVGGFLGLGNHYVAVNPSAVDINFDSGARKWRAAMNTDADQLQAAPEYKYSSND